MMPVGGDAGFSKIIGLKRTLSAVLSPFEAIRENLRTFSFKYAYALR